MSTIGTAFEQLLDEMKRHIIIVREQIKDANDQHDFEQVAALAGVAQKLKNALDEIEVFASTVAAIVPAVESLSIDTTQSQDSPQSATKKSAPLAKGLRTPDTLYVPHLLAALNELGGHGTSHAVIDRVGQRMVSILNEYDYQMLASQPDMPRWRNAVAWVRQMLVDQGLLRKDSPHGTWELSDKGQAQANSKAPQEIETEEI